MPAIPRDPPSDIPPPPSSSSSLDHTSKDDHPLPSSAAQSQALPAVAAAITAPSSQRPADLPDPATSAASNSNSNSSSTFPPPTSSSLSSPSPHTMAPSVISPLPRHFQSHLPSDYIMHPMSRSESTHSTTTATSDYLPNSFLSPALSPSSTPGTVTPSHEHAPLKGVPVSPHSVPKTLLPELPRVNCEVRARIPTTHGTEIFLHLYTNSIDNKEHLAIVFGDKIRSKSLDAVRPGETEHDRMVRGAYVGRLRPGRTSSKFDDSPAASPSLKAADAKPVGESGKAGDKDPSAAKEEQDTSHVPLVRIHSECYTGETAWSARCDCGEQLDEAARLMSSPHLSPSGGCIVYLRQEGRGIGLGEKLKAYNLQDLGNDTVQANLLLRHPADARSYGLATSILMDLGLTEVRLLTNNPDKIAAVEGPGREVRVRERVPMVPIAWRGGEGGVRGREVGEYLKTKIQHMGHLLPMPDELPQ